MRGGCWGGGLGEIGRVDNLGSLCYLVIVWMLYLIFFYEDWKWRVVVEECKDLLVCVG